MALSCRELTAMLGEYQDQTLDSAKRMSAETHLLTCDECMAYLKSYEQTIRLSKRAFRDAIDSGPGEIESPALKGRATFARRFAAEEARFKTPHNLPSAASNVWPQEPLLYKCSKRAAFPPSTLA